ncbi:MAG: D-2-hydroxyacid dehydrogenase [Thiolinea sp.]
MPDAVFLDFGSTSRDDLDLTRLQAACGSLQLWPYTTLQQRSQHIGKAEVIISNKVMLDAQLLASMQHQIKLICVAATGTNNVDLSAAQRFRIPVTNVRDYASQSVAEHTIALLFALARQIPAYREVLQQGKWQASPHFCLLDYPITELAGKTFGIIGYGMLGKATARLAEALGMQILIADRLDAVHLRPGRVSLDELLTQADVVSLHCPLNEQTRDLINAQRLRQMKPSAFLLNTARGGLVNEADLLAALRSGTIAGAGMDVLEQEPPAADSLLLQAALPNLLLSPHVAWASQRARQTLIDQLADIITAWKQGQLLNAVT